MNKVSFSTTLTALGLLLVSAFSAAATVDFTWGDPKQFQDMKYPGGNDARFQARVIKELEEQFRREAEKLPADQILSVTVNDVDLAGYIEYFHPGYPFGLRVIRNIDYPTIDLSYMLKDANSDVIQSGEGKIKNLGFRNATLSTLQREPLRYEVELIKDWYQTEFK